MEELVRHGGRASARNACRRVRTDLFLRGIRLGFRPTTTTYEYLPDGTINLGARYIIIIIFIIIIEYFESVDY